MLMYGVVGHLVDEYMRMSESTFFESMYKFCKTVIQVFVGEYLREPNVANIAWLLCQSMSQ
jgi:hypothetical protein